MRSTAARDSARKLERYRPRGLPRILPASAWLAREPRVAPPVVLLVGNAADHRRISLPQLRQQQRDFLGPALQVVVDRDHLGSAGVVQPAQGRVLLVLIARELHDAHARLAGARPLHHRVAVVGTRVVDQDDLPGPRLGIERRFQPLHERGQQRRAAEVPPRTTLTEGVSEGRFIVLRARASNAIIGTGNRGLGDSDRIGPRNVKVPFNRPYMTGRELGYIAQAHQNHKLAGDGPFTAAAAAGSRSTPAAKQALLTHSCTARARDGGDPRRHRARRRGDHAVVHVRLDRQRVRAARRRAGVRRHPRPTR